MRVNEVHNPPPKRRQHAGGFILRKKVIECNIPVYVIMIINLYTINTTIQSMIVSSLLIVVLDLIICKLEFALTAVSLPDISGLESDQTRTTCKCTERKYLF